MRGILLAIALTGCAERAPGPPPTRPTAQSAVSSPAAQADAAPVSLAGQWRVAGIDGQPFDEAYGLALAADDRRIWWEPICAGYVRDYRIESGRIDFGPDPHRPDPPGLVSVCPIGPPPRLADVMRAIDSAETVRRTAANGIELAGGGRSLTLFSQ